MAAKSPPKRRSSARIAAMAADPAPSPAVTRRFAGNFEGTPGRLVPGEEVTEPERPRPPVNRKPTRKPTMLQGGAAKRRAAAAAAAANAAAAAPAPAPKEDAPLPVQKDLPPLPETPKGGRKKAGVAGRVRAALAKGKRTLAKAVGRRSTTAAAAARSPAGKKAATAASSVLSPRAKAAYEKKVDGVAAVASWLDRAAIEELLRQTNGDVNAAITLAVQQKKSGDAAGRRRA